MSLIPDGFPKGDASAPTAGFGNETRRYDPETDKLSGSIRLVYSQDDIQRALTASHTQVVSEIRFGANILIDKPITLATDGLIIDGADFQLSGDGYLFQVQADCQIRDLRILSTNATNLFVCDEDVGFKAINLDITTDGYTTSVFHVPGAHTKTELSQISVNNSGTLISVFSGTSSESFVADHFRLSGVIDLFSTGTTYQYVGLTSFHSLDSQAELKGSFKGCAFINFREFVNVDLTGSSGSGNVFQTFVYSSGSSIPAFIEGSNNTAIGIRGYSTAVINSTSTLIGGSIGSTPFKSAYFPLRVGIGDTAPPVKLSVNGEIKIGSESTTASDAGAGAIRYSSGLQVSDGATWGSAAAQAPEEPIRFPYGAFDLPETALTKALGNQQTSAVYFGRATAAFTQMKVLYKVNIAPTTVVYAECAVCKGTPILSTQTTLTTMGFVSLVGSTSLGLKTITISLSGIAVGDHLWIAFGSNISSGTFQLDACIPDRYSSGRHLISTGNARPSTMAAATGFSVESVGTNTLSVVCAPS